MEQTNGVEQCKSDDYPWKSPEVPYTAMAINQEEYLEEAKSDPLWANVNSIEEKEPMIWEVYNSKVKELVKEKSKSPEEGESKVYFRFYNDRAYIVLCWHKAAITYIHDLHIWVSKHCSSEDYKLAAIKAEQLYLLLDNPVLHREVQLSESDTFHTYFKVEVRRKPKSDSEIKNKYDKCSLLQFHEEKPGMKGKRKQWMVERKFLQGNLCSDDVFVIMDDYHVYLWVGEKSIKEERDAALKYIEQRKRSHKFSFAEVGDSVNDKDHRAYHLFPPKGKMLKRTAENAPIKPFNTLYTLTRDDGQLGRGKTGFQSRLDLKSDSIHLLDTESHLYVWIGNEVGYQERCRALFAAENFLGSHYSKDVEGKFHVPINKPITLVNEDNPYLLFDRAFTRSTIQS